MSEECNGDLRLDAELNEKLSAGAAEGSMVFICVLL
jgi:hypothetical protein